MLNLIHADFTQVLGIKVLIMKTFTVFFRVFLFFAAVNGGILHAACDDYDNTNDSCPGATVTSMDGVNVDRQRCIEGRSKNGDKPDLYKFTVQAFGTLDINGSSLNNSSYHFMVGSSCRGGSYYSDHTGYNHHVSINLIKGDTVYIYAKESGNSYDKYRINFDFKVDTTFKANDDTYETLPNQSIAMDIEKNDNPGANGPLQNLTIVTSPSHGTAVVNGEKIEYTPNNGYTGNDTLVYSVDDNSTPRKTSRATVKITIGTIVNKGDRPFTVRNPPNTRNIVGNYAIIGNSSQCALNNRSNSLSGDCINSYSNKIPSRFIDIDGDATTKNSSSSTLHIPPKSEVLWAGLYWQGVVHNSIHGKDFMGDRGSYNGQTISGKPKFSTGKQIDFEKSGSTYGAEKVFFKVPNSNYTEITADVLDYHNLGYACFKDVTSMIDINNSNGIYMVADIKSHQGIEQDHGNYAAWSLVIIYRNNTTEKPRNITLFDGYSTVDKYFRQDLIIDGFLTPKTPPIGSKLAVFAMDGDNGINSLTVINEKGNSTNITNQDDSSHRLFDSTISRSIARDPNATSLRTDLKVLNLTNVLGTSETKATLKPRSGGDRYTPSFFIMSADLYVPKLCYDYAVDLGTGTVYTDDDHNITGPISADRNMTTKVFIKTTQADFDLENSILVVKDLNASKWDFDGGEYSPSTSMAYFTADINDSRADYSAIGFGDDDGNMHDGGIIHPDTNYYAKFYHTLKSGQPLYVRDHLDIDVVSHIDFGSGAVPYRFSTEDGSLPRCTTSLVYNPIYGRFSVERNNNTGETIPEKYTLYTQISGREFPVDVVSYDGNSSTELTIDKIGVEVELFDAATFENNASSGFDTVCRDYDKHRIHNNQFVAFSNASRAPLKAADLAVPIALRSAAFRVWYIADVNNSLVFDDTCYTTGTAGRDSCFAGKYPQVKSRLDPTGLCSAQCTGGGSGCYECLKVNFGHPVCSRDNFAIRPESYRIVIKDAGKDGNNTNRIEIARNNTTNQFEYAAGYKYRIEANATLWHKEDNARKYYKIFGGSNVTKLKFDGNSTCTDRNGTEQSTYIFDNGKLSNIIAGDNAGNYTYDIVDKDWTAVDQKGNPLKPYRNFNDCNKGSGDVDLNPNKRSGCQIKSELDTTHTQMKLWFHPYAFDVSGIRLQTHPHTGSSWVYMNNLHTVGSQSDTMAAVVEGNITAVGAHGKRLSNYTASCAAKDIGLSTKFISDPSPVVDANGNTVDFEQIIKDNSGVFDPNSIEKADNNLTLPSDYFDNNGTAEVAVYYNFMKPYDKTVNVADVNFTTLLALGINDKSNADMQNNYIPTGDVAIDQNVSFYFAKVAPPPGIDGTTVYDPSIDVDFRVLAYCDTAIKGTCRYPGMDPNSVEGLSGTAGWYLMSGHQSALGDGKVTTLSVESTDPSGHAGDVSISNTGPILFTNGVYTTDTLGCAFDKRPLKATFVLDPDEWLKYNPGNADGRPRFDLYFLREQLNWKGMGETGHVISTEPHHNQSGRMGW